ncbi:unnamed protein product [marine sediment metagenome]|uniref:Replication-associated protein ORF2/G2P domain-containing protein n=1 Tax=marine sediment metagenome TaxID=412755 RepID=X1KP65_9ZZZZ
MVALPQSPTEFDSDQFTDEGLGSFSNSSGMIRLFKTREWFLDGGDIGGLVDVYKKWVAQDEFLHFAVFEGDTKVREVAVLCSKRGNAVYRYRVEDRLSPLLNLDVPAGNRSWNKTKVCFVTLTYDTKLSSPQEAWVSISKSFNTWITNVRNQFGKVSYLKCFESTRGGYPHLHLVLVFHEVDFSYFALKGKFRVSRIIRDKIKGNWSSFADIEAVISPKQAIHYVLKYLLKTHGDSAPGKTAWEISCEGVEKTLAILWAYKKRGYSVSGDIEAVLADLIPKPCVTQTFQLTLVGGRLERWVLLGVKSATELGIRDKPPPFTVVLWETSR